MSENLLYNRFASLIVASRDANGNQLVAKEFTNLRINFSIEKTSESNANTAKIKVYNLSQSNRSFVEQKGQALILNVGYAPTGLEPLVGTIFKGDIGICRNEKNGPDWVTSFEVGDGQKSLDEKTYQRTFRDGALAETIIKDVVGAFGLAIGTVKGIKNKSYKSGITLSGSAKEVMDKVAADSGVEWSIQDGEVQVLPPTDALNNQAILISEQTGMINSPVKRADSGIDVVCLINPRLRPGILIKVESESINGFYRVRKVNFEGDSFEGEFKCKVEAVDLQTPVVQYAE